MAANLKIVTFNIRFPWEGDGTNSLFCRFGLILDKIAEQKPDVIFFQEATPKNMGVLRESISPEYMVILNQREVDYTGEGLAIAYKKERLSLYGLEVFWLSPTPKVVASRFEGQSKHSRICQRVMLKDEKTGNVFRVYNLHLEELSEEVRYLQMKVVMQRVKEDMVLDAMPFFIVGDFNATPDEKAIQYCLAENECGICDLTSNIAESYHEFGKINPAHKIDYILADKETARSSFSVVAWKDEVNGVYLSDHYPIALEIEM